MDKINDCYTKPLVDIIIKSDSEYLSHLINLYDELAKNSKIRLYKNNELLITYLEQISQIINNNIDMDFFEENRISALDVFYNIEEKSFTNTSNYFFPGDLTAFYPNIRLLKASKPLSCHISGSKIYTNSHYILYQPLIENLKTGKAYVLDKSIKTESYYDNLLPQNIMELEDFTYKLQNSYNLDYDEEIDFYCFSTNYGSDLIKLRELKKPKRRY